VWAREELESFVEVYKRQVFGSKSGISAIADCVYIARTSCTKVSVLVHRVYVFKCVQIN